LLIWYFADYSLHRPFGLRLHMTTFDATALEALSKKEPSPGLSFY